MFVSGRISYTNDLPIYAAFDEGALRYPGTLYSDIPASLNRMLASGQLGLSPISAFAYAANAEKLALMPDICIGSRDTVWSVICVSRRPLKQLDGAVIAVTAESASGLNLLRVLLERRFGVRAMFETVEDPYAAACEGRPTLLIGDRAIDAQLSFPAESVHDLGLLWHEWTGHDMVYAVWAARRDVLVGQRAKVADAMLMLGKARAWGMEHISRVIELAQATHPRATGVYEAYYRTLNFDFDRRARNGLLRYFEELRAIGVLSSIPSLEPEAFVVNR
jgi:chorismate dehydratase